MQEYDNFFRAHSKMVQLVSKNIDLEKECMKMENQIEVYEKQL